VSFFLQESRKRDGSRRHASFVQIERLFALRYIAIVDSGSPA